MGKDPWDATAAKQLQDILDAVKNTGGTIRKPAENDGTGFDVVAGGMPIRIRCWMTGDYGVKLQVRLAGANWIYTDLGPESRAVLLAMGTLAFEQRSEENALQRNEVKQRWQEVQNMAANKWCSPPPPAEALAGVSG